MNRAYHVFIETYKFNIVFNICDTKNKLFGRRVDIHRKMKYYAHHSCTECNW